MKKITISLDEYEKVENSFNKLIKDNEFKNEDELDEAIILSTFKEVNKEGDNK